MADKFAVPLLHRKPLLLPLTKSFVVLASLSLLASVIWLIWDARETRLDEARSTSENLAAALAQHAEDTLKAADNVLLGLVERLEVDGQDEPRMPRLQRFMQQRVQELPDLHSLLAFDRDGNWLTSSYGERPLDHNNTDREYFKWHSEHEDNRVHISSPLPGRSSGEWVIPVTRRLNDAGGRFNGVVVASVRVDYFQQVYRSLDIKYQGFISLSLSDGTILVREPPSADNGLLSNTLPLQQNSGNFNRIEHGRKRMYSYKRLERYPLVVMTALTQDEVLANWQTEAVMQIAVVVILIILLNLFSFYLIHLVKAELDTHKALQQAQDHLSEQRIQLEKLALEDELTGLANRRHFMGHLREELRRSRRARMPLALLMLDVDLFKQYNDLYGHAGGDQCLREVAKVLLKGQNRPGDLAARYGGEEFCLLLSATDSEGAALVAEKVRHALELRAITHGGSPLGILTISIGVHSLYPANEIAQDVGEVLLQCADIALYQAKEGGRNRVVLYQEE